MTGGMSRGTGTKGRRFTTLMPTATMRPAITKRVPAKVRMEARSVESMA